MDFSDYLIAYRSKYRIKAHILFWLAVVLLSVTTNYFGDKNYSIIQALVYAITLLISQLLSAYFLAYFIFPRFWDQRKYFSSILLWLLGVYLLSVFSRILVVYGAEPIIFRLTGDVPVDETEPIAVIFTDLYKLFKVYFYFTLSIPFVFLAFKFFKAQHELYEKNLVLENQKIISELELLKAQLNPHFLFNTLNNIYSLSLYNSPQTSDAIGRLSGILDYLLFQSKRRFVPVSHEWKIVVDYCELERLRYDQDLKLEMTCEVETDTDIIPLILVSLVENAFKHGAGSETDSPWIKISLKSTTECIGFEVTNTYVEHVAPIEKQQGLGLQNIQRQLSLTYGGKQTLNFNRENGIFSVALKINRS
ncbi:sensor histidine kinase [Xanthocytophaga flavus]|nr:histidine kinase [Xanthocytophaga flavus]